MEPLTLDLVRNVQLKPTAFRYRLLLHSILDSARVLVLTGLLQSHLPFVPLATQRIELRP